MGTFMRNLPTLFRTYGIRFLVNVPFSYRNSWYLRWAFFWEE